MARRVPRTRNNSSRQPTDMTKQQLEQIANPDLSKATKPRRRLFNQRTLNVFEAATAIDSLGEAVYPAAIRKILDKSGLNTQDRGNQWIGDSLGAHGLNLPRYKQKGKVCYRLPAGGITRELIAERFLVPTDFDWGSAPRHPGQPNSDSRG